MIVLRGALKADENGTWRWKGVWAFGSLPSAAREDAATTTTSPAAADAESSSTSKPSTTTAPRGRPRLQHPPPTSRPFDYTWEKAALPWQVLIPSANPMPGDDDDEGATNTTTIPISREKHSNVGDAKINDAPKIPLAQEEQKQSSGEVSAAATKPSHDDDVVPLEASVAGDVIPESAAAAQEKVVTTLTPDETGRDAIVETQEQVSDQANEPKTNDPNRITFASTMPGDPPFTDASLANPEKCPPGGSWKGYFENLPKRRDKAPSQVPESFHLFFNATPPKDARVIFTDEDNRSEDEGKKLLEHHKQQLAAVEGTVPPGHVHVRGCGTNEFGIFEILGSLHLETGILECQRIYVAVPEATPSYRTPRRPSNDPVHSGGSRGVKSLRPCTTTTTDSNDSNRPYLTRKRQLSWKRRSNVDSDGEDDLNSGRKGSSSSKKRVKLDDKPIVFPALETIQVVSPLVSPPLFRAGSRPKKPPSSPCLLPVKKKATSSSVEDSSSNINAASSTPSTTADSNRLKLPDAGDPRKARWRAAHFLYYQRHEPTTNEDGTKGSSSSAPSYVVYEGEMQDSLRWGYGTCLYNNGMLYEGEWKRNKEHGKGTLMTSDRSRVIYEGEWERGRMHGKGTYYYGQADQINRKKDNKKAKPDGSETSRYEGEFKENMRHGFGTYYLPDGSVYAGMWREGFMSGRGVLTWPDNSVYDGEFRDGKRNGQGLLKTSDGFTYDGMWVQNAMEGRGSAIYPNGQRYDGLFSNGRREGRGTIRFTNGAVYEGRFRDDAMDGQGTMKISRAVVVPRSNDEQSQEDDKTKKEDFMIPVSFQSDMSHIHQKAGFNEGGE